MLTEKELIDKHRKLAEAARAEHDHMTADLHEAIAREYAQNGASGFGPEPRRGEAKDAALSNRRARLHKALDCVLDTQL